ncbi:hypothetical protein RRG08_014626 [Elysia crispata]|uniref:Uncharacterized protein n=1 Tax=Elysia crispata TaxID=231223 RepID=A0AAE0YRH4_9GAST|nr:hypothetical protein RRG08_014626 [Elysia crispata]
MRFGSVVMATQQFTVLNHGLWQWLMSLWYMYRVEWALRLVSSETLSRSVARTIQKPRQFKLNKAAPKKDAVHWPACLSGSRATRAVQAKQSQLWSLTTVHYPGTVWAVKWPVLMET